MTMAPEANLFPGLTNSKNIPDRKSSPQSLLYKVKERELQQRSWRLKFHNRNRDSEATTIYQL